MMHNKNKSVDRGTRMMALCVAGALCVVTSAIIIPLITPDFGTPDSQVSTPTSLKAQESPSSSDKNPATR